MSAGLAPEAELALLVCGTRERRERAAARIAELAEAADEASLVAVLREQRILLLAATRLEHAATGVLSQQLREAVAGAYAAERARAMLFSAAADRLVDELEQTGIPAVALKGPTLAIELYGDPALREYADLDVLVAPAQLGAALGVAARLGWTEPAPGASPGTVALPALHHAVRHPQGALPELELHWRVHWYEARFAAEALRRSVLDTDGARRLQPLDQLAMLLLFYARDGFTGLRLVADIGTWWDLHGDADVLVGLRELAGLHPALAETWRAALTSATAVAGLPIDPVAHGLLPVGHRAKLAVRLANWRLEGDADQVIANVVLVDGLLAPRGARRTFLRRHALGPGHVVKTAGRCGLGLWGLRSGASWDPVGARSVRGLDDLEP